MSALGGGRIGAASSGDGGAPVQGLTYVNGEGPRMRRVRNVLSKSLTRSLGEIRATWFRKIFREIPAHARFHEEIDAKKRKRKKPEDLTLDDVPSFRATVTEDKIKQMFQNISDETHKSFEEVIKKRKLVEKLNALDKLVNEQPVMPGTNQRVPPSLKDAPEHLIRAGRMKAKIVDRDRLKEILVKEEQKRETLEADLMKSRELAKKCAEVLKEHVAKVDEAHVAALSGSTSAGAGLTASSSKSNK